MLVNSRRKGRIRFGQVERGWDEEEHDKKAKTKR